LGEKSRVGELSLNEIEKFAINENNFRWIRFTGGEPFLRKDLVEIIKVFRDKSKKLKIINTTTNSFDPDYIYSQIQRISELKIGRVIIGISLDGYEKLHNYIRGVDSFKNAITLFKSLKNIDTIEVLFSYTISKYNNNQFSKAFENVKEYIPDISIADFNFNIYETSSIYYMNEGQRLKTEDRQALINEFLFLNSLLKKQKSNNIEQKVINKYVELLPLYVNDGRTPLSCSAARSSFFIDPYGNVFPCITWNKKLGNIRDTDYSLKKIVESGNIDDIRRIISEYKCPNCWTPCEAHPSIITNVLTKHINL